MTSMNTSYILRNKPARDFLDAAVEEFLNGGGDVDVDVKGRTTALRFNLGAINPQNQHSPDKVQQVRDLCASGYSMRDIGMRLSISAKTVSRIMKENDIQSTTTSWAKGQEARARQKIQNRTKPFAIAKALLAQGVGVVEVAKQAGVARQTINRWINEYNLRQSA